MQKLPGYYIAGFVDGEGCFALKFRRDVRHERKSKPVYFYWDIEFTILLRGDDRELLEKIKSTFECGNISMNNQGAARYAVTNIDDLTNKVVPFFFKYKLFGKKRLDFELWKEAVEIFQRNQRKGTNIHKGENRFHKVPWDPKDIERLRKIHEEMKKYKSIRPNWKWL